jgi:hypothetical protein
MIPQMRKDITTLKARMKALDNLTVEGFNRHENRGGVSFVVGAPALRPIWIPPKTVVIVKRPEPADMFLLVREAKYIDLPPMPCTTEGETTICYYEWYGVEFEVYPPLGKQAIDYDGDGDEWLPADNDHPPKLDTVFHRAHREHNAWVLQSEAEGGASIEFVKILDSIPVDMPTAKFLTVQRMKVDEVSGLWVADGETEEAETWPNYTAQHYLPMRLQFPDVIVPMTRVNGTQYVWQKNRMFLAEPLSTLAQSDCVVPIR